MRHLKWPKRENKVYLRGGILSLLLFFSLPLIASPLKIAVLDTGFCPDKLSYSKNITFKESIDLTKSNHFDCKKLKNENRRLHGNWVLERFLKELPSGHEIEITPFIIFDKHAKQNEAYWSRAFSKQNDYHLFIIAAGIKSTPQLENIKISIPIVVAGATLGRGIQYKSILWPQSQFKLPNVFTIGSYTPKDSDLPARPDYTLINPTQMKFFFEGGGANDSFKGTSRACAIASAKAIHHCYQELKKREPLATCLDKVKKKIEIFNDNEKVEVLSF